MSNRFLISVAVAALIAGTGFANAQGMNREGGSGGATVQQGAPPSGGGAPSATQHRDEPSSGMKSGQSEKAPGGMKSGQSEKAPGGMKSGQTEEKAPGAAKNKQAEEGMKGQKSQQNTVSDTDRAKGGKDMKAEGREGSKNAQSKEGMSKDSTTTTQSREGMSKDSTTNAQTKSGTDRSQATGQSQTTTGQAGAAARLSTEQRTQISTVIRSQRVEPVTNINFSISVGTRVPRDVRFHPLPAEVVTIYPEWRGYEFILVRHQILVIDPRTFEIVAILEA